MNERIKDLYNQALVLAGQENQFETTNTDVIEKFAELIVQECTTLINEIPLESRGFWSDGYYNGCRDSAKTINKHFGFEE